MSAPRPTPGPWHPRKKASGTTLYSYQWGSSSSTAIRSPMSTSELKLKKSSSVTAENHSSQHTFGNFQSGAGASSSTASRTGISAPFRPPINKPAPQADPSPGKTYTICGVKVEFPHQAYPAQIGMMEKVMRCLTQNQNGLLESPTGSGKSLALLCSSLAWQSRESEKLIATKEKQRAATAIPFGSYGRNTPGMPVKPDQPGQTDATRVLVELPEPHCKTEVQMDNQDDLSSFSSQCPTPAVQCGAACTPASLGPPGRPDESGSSLGPTGLGQPTRKHQPNRPRPRKQPKGVVFDSTDDDDIAAPMPREAIDRMQSLRYPGSSAASAQVESTSNGVNAAEAASDSIPKIYFGSRTHKQIAQLVRELKKTSYGNLRMTVLGSKEQYCIHPVISRQRNKNEACQELLDGGAGDDGFVAARGRGMTRGCEFYNNAKAGGGKGFTAMRKLGLPPAYDIEDLSDIGRKHIVCPYFVSRNLAMYAQLIFCPYNYLVDARIRAAMEINLDGQIVIFDEGHNMEDASREAASFGITNEEIQFALEDMSRAASIRHPLDPDGEMCEGAVVQERIKEAMQICRQLMEWMMQMGRNIPSSGYQGGGSTELVGADFLLHLNNVGLGPDEFDSFREAVAAVDEDKKGNASGQSEGPEEGGGTRGPKTNKVSGITLGLLKGLVVVLGYIYGNGQRHLPDYRFALMKERNHNNAYIEDENGFRRKRKQEEVNEFLFRLHFWCLNPAVAFGDFSKVKAIMLTSGTLSPIISFQSELGLPFGIQFEASHVIAMDQVWAGGVARGPRNTELKGVFTVTNQLAYQDDVGQSVLEICQTVPKGVLCFFTSYAVMDKLLQRWNESGMIAHLQACKVVLQEPRNTFGDKNIFENVMEEFYAAIRGESLEGGQTGAVMFAVCRGKISEGLDFADNNARAVIAVGIPFPNFKDEQVTMKRAYNTANLKRGLLSGDQWYDIQAFRALNQALGRCLRHKNDWGALILLDVRFATGQPANNRFIQGLSKWLRPQIRPYNNFRVALGSLAEFVRIRIAADALRNPAPVAAIPVNEAPVIDLVDENILSDTEFSGLFLEERQSSVVPAAPVEDNLLTDDELSSLFTSDDDAFSPVKRL